MTASERVGVTVLITAHNAQSYIAEAVRSAFTTAASCDEILLVLDGCEDETGIIGESAAGGDGRLRIIDSARLGRAGALNVGVREATYDLIAINDADDLSHPSRLQLYRSTLSLLGDCRWGAIAGQAIEFADDERPSAAWFEQRGAPPGLNNFQERLRRYNPVAHSTILWNRTALDEVGGFDVNRRSQFDYELLVRCAQRGFGLYQLTEELAAVRSHQHRAFGSRNQVSYRLRSLGVQWSALRTIAGSGFDYAYLPARVAYLGFGARLPKRFLRRFR